MAFEKAETRDSDNLKSLLNIIFRADLQDSLLTSCCYLTLTKSCMLRQLYDSAIHYAHLSLQYQPNESNSMLLLAQAYSYKSNKDSSVYYAHLTLENSSDLFNRNNALYILTNEDESIDKSKIRERASERADIQKILEISQGKYSQAVQLLEQDIHRKPNRRWIYTLVAIIFTFCSGCILNHTNKKHKRLQQQRMDYSQKRNADLKISCAALRKSENLKIELEWDDYDSMCSIVNARLGGIADKLKAIPNITTNDIRLCVLVLLDLSYEDTAMMLNLSSKSIAKLKSITAHKLGTSMRNLHDKLTQIACSDEAK